MFFGKQLFLTSILNETLPLQLITSEELVANHIPENVSYLVIQIKLGNEFSKKVDSIEEEILSEWKTSFNKSIVDTMKKIPSIDFLDLVHLQPYTRTMIFTLPKFTSIESIAPEIKKFFKQLVDIMHTNYNCKIIGFMSPIVDGIKMLSRAYKKARSLQDFQYIQGMGSFNFHKNNCTISSETMVESKMVDRFSQLLLSEDLEKLNELLSSINRHLFNNYSTNSKSEYIYKELFTALTKYLYSFGRYYYENIKTLNNCIINFDNCFNDIYEACEWLEIQLVKIFDAKVENMYSMHPYILKVIKKIETNYYEDLSLSSFAEEFNVTIAYLSRLFKEHYKMNFKDYLTYTRMKKAKILLKTTKLSIKEISVKVGYDTPNSFNRMFKKVEGITPSTYRLE